MNISRHIFLGFFLVISLLHMTSCNEGDTYDEQVEQINDLVAKNGWVVSEIISEGVWVVIDEAGGSDKPNNESNIKVKYKGYFYDGTLFDQNEALSIKLGNTIRGWQLGIPKFGRGGKGKLLITSDKGYGESSSIGIRPNAMLVFELELLDF